MVTCRLNRSRVQDRQQQRPDSDDVAAMPAMQARGAAPEQGQ
ncbi:hypothetical protein [Algiphilus sp.]|nr:hypothetical protein [Algiphilus sp.]